MVSCISSHGSNASVEAANQNPNRLPRNKCSPKISARSLFLGGVALGILGGAGLYHLWKITSDSISPAPLTSKSVEPKDIPPTATVDEEGAYDRLPFEIPMHLKGRELIEQKKYAQVVDLLRPIAKSGHLPAMQLILDAGKQIPIADLKAIKKNFCIGLDRRAKDYEGGVQKGGLAKDHPKCSDFPTIFDS